MTWIPPERSRSVSSAMVRLEGFVELRPRRNERETVPAMRGPRAPKET
jgi:hypothetical protein